MKSFIFKLVFKGFGLLLKIYIKYKRISQAVGGISQEQQEQENNEGVKGRYQVAGIVLTDSC